MTPDRSYIDYSRSELYGSLQIWAILVTPDWNLIGRYRMEFYWLLATPEWGPVAQSRTGVRLVPPGHNFIDLSRSELYWAFQNGALLVTP